MVRFRLSDLRKRRTFFVFFGSYLILLLLPVIAGSLIYRSIDKLTSEETYRHTADTFKRCVQDLDGQLADLENYVTQLTLDTAVADLFYSTDAFPGPAISRVYAAWRRLGRLPAPGALAGTVLLYSAQYNVFITRYTSFLQTDRFYPAFFSYADLSFDDWSRRFLQPAKSGEYHPEKPVLLSGQEMKALAYNRSVPLGEAEIYRGTVVVLMDAAAVTEVFAPVIEGGAVLLSLFDSSGAAMMISGQKGVRDPTALLRFESIGQINLEQDSSGMSLFTSVMDRKGWTAAIAVPSKVLLVRIRHMRATAIGIAALIVIAGAAVAFWLAYRNSAPLVRIMEDIRAKLNISSSPASYGYKFLSATVAQLLRSRSSLEKSVQTQLPQVRAVFFERLIRGEFTDNKEIKLIAEHIHFPLTAERYVILLVRIGGYHDLLAETVLVQLTALRAILKTEIQRKLTNSSYCHDISEDTLAVLIAAPSNDRCSSNCEDLFIALLKASRGNLAISVTVAGGSVKGSASHICSSFEEAKHALHHSGTANRCGEEIAWFSSILIKTGYYYPIEVEAQLEVAVRASKIGKVEEILNRIYSMNFDDRSLSHSTAVDLYYELKGTVLKVSETLVADDEEALQSIKASIDQIQEFGDPKETFDILLNTYGQICGMVEGRMKSHNSELTKNIVSYLKEHYADTDLCLSKVALCFRISEMYLSQFFKEQTGQNFHDYIELMRMKDAKSLLVVSKLSVKEISKAVGYSNSNTFLKAFKRRHGVTPTTHRKQVRSV